MAIPNLTRGAFIVQQPDVSYALAVDGLERPIPSAPPLPEPVPEPYQGEREYLCLNRCSKLFTLFSLCVAWAVFVFRVRCRRK